MLVYTTKRISIPQSLFDMEAKDNAVHEVSSKILKGFLGDLKKLENIIEKGGVQEDDPEHGSTDGDASSSVASGPQNSVVRKEDLKICLQKARRILEASKDTNFTMDEFFDLVKDFRLPGNQTVRRYVDNLKEQNDTLQTSFENLQTSFENLQNELIELQKKKDETKKSAEGTGLGISFLGLRVTVGKSAMLLIVLAISYISYRFLEGSLFKITDAAGDAGAEGIRSFAIDFSYIYRWLVDRRLGTALQRQIKQEQEYQDACIGNSHLPVCQQTFFENLNRAANSAVLSITDNSAATRALVGSVIEEKGGYESLTDKEKEWCQLSNYCNDQSSGSIPFLSGAAMNNVAHKVEDIESNQELPGHSQMCVNGTEDLHTHLIHTIDMIYMGIVLSG